MTDSPFSLMRLQLQRLNSQAVPVLLSYPDAKNPSGDPLLKLIVLCPMPGEKTGMLTDTCGNTKAISKALERISDIQQISGYMGHILPYSRGALHVYELDPKNSSDAAYAPFIEKLKQSGIRRVEMEPQTAKWLCDFYDSAIKTHSKNINLYEHDEKLRTYYSDEHSHEHALFSCIYQVIPKDQQTYQKAAQAAYEAGKSIPDHIKQSIQLEAISQDAFLKQAINYMLIPVVVEAYESILSEQERVGRS